MAQARIHVSLIAIPDAVISTLGGIYDVLNSFEAAAKTDPAVPEVSPFEVEIVSEAEREIRLASGLPISAHRQIEEVSTTNIVIVPSVLVSGEAWASGRYPNLVNWVSEKHLQGATLCSACSGLFLLAETGLFDGQLATVHWAYAEKFINTFPSVPIAPDRVLIVSGAQQELITSGASTSWHDLALHLIATRVGPSAALGIARFYALEWHHDGLTPFVVFSPRLDHGDATIRMCQDWLANNFTVAKPVEELIRISGLRRRTFIRRFTFATSLKPLSYIQQVRVEDAKRRLESTSVSVDEISWEVGYEEPAFFRRVFKRITGMTPSAYRTKFRLPQPKEFRRIGSG